MVSVRSTRSDDKEHAMPNIMALFVYDPTSSIDARHMPYSDCSFPATSAAPNDVSYCRPDQDWVADGACYNRIITRHFLGGPPNC